MKLVDEKPARGETRYWAHLGYGDIIYLIKCEVLDIKWDYDNEYDVFKCKKLKEVVKSPPPGVSQVFTVDFAWELQPTLEQAIHLLFMGIFSGDKDFFFRQRAPF